MPGVDAWDKPELVAGSDLKASTDKQEKPDMSEDEELNASDMAVLKSLINKLKSKIFR